MPLLGNGQQATAAIRDAVFRGVVRMKIQRNDNGTYVGEFHYDPNLDDPTQAAADAALANIANVLSQNAKVVLVRSSATNYSITAA